ncbi:hypothetical protein C9374_010254 [Naegleria lovaniensis]|uniref:RNA 3'-terminal phosphate cyclase-like protein n=1 Tax=Naegleria lovaniensis TaxID=51637 RepID=A0AA88GC45_NAELO|nr:uncharacterized protein C9374_010254 [Naegleria lovaniensis]KAG2374880.1 hypothetical protein C9374_010254 [Naegleria lovaniensis]
MKQFLASQREKKEQERKVQQQARQEWMQKQAGNVHSSEPSSSLKNSSVHKSNSVATPSQPQSNALIYSGAKSFRMRIILSTISNRPVQIRNIRPQRGGIREFERNFLLLIDKITKGSKIEISEDGETVTYKPGVIVGSGIGSLVFDCGLERGIAYYLEALICLCPFGKNASDILLKGITNHPLDPSVDMYRNCTLHLFEHFTKKHAQTVPPQSLQILKRGAPPLGGGEVRFECPIVKEMLNPIQILDEGMIKRVRGIAYSTRVAPNISNRLVDGAKSMLNLYLPDIWIHTDHYSGKTSGSSPGWSIYLQAETDTGCRLCTEYIPDQSHEIIPNSVDLNGDKEWMKIPEDVGKHAAKLLFEEIHKGGCVDSINQFFIFYLMSLTSEDVSKIRIGKLNPYAIAYLRHIRDFLGVVFKISPEHDSRTVVLSCVGSGYKNIARKSN